MLTTLRSWIHWLVRNEGITSTAEEADTYGPWHGDHWHNLLCSPMDARHYVMEDWSLQPEPPHAEAR
ncbi:hypothetical protein [Paraburkholderia acidisoli]|uniref:Uncharacterized protein n=1 Tax=Paraburkholderia acidisoli TaxID=2571748 RepID=A0A7Z2GHU0_9BURK|nr:hypothetical protein [Paraburkholderia acidisoli]QGZ62036.1 hypothetical protein FAZ98_10005 [Paraburkholderia acidisoli]